MKTNHLACAFLLLAAAPLAAQEAGAEFHASNEFSFTQNEMSGPGKAASSLSKGLNYLEILNLYGNGTKGAWNYNYTVGAKATDDDRSDPKRVSLTSLQGRVTNNIHTLAVGDVFESFSQYSLATSLKGGSYRFFKEGTRLPEITGVFGWAYPRWDSVWKDPLTRSINRQAAGLRVKENFNGDLWAGLSAVSAKDTGRLASSDALYDAKNYTMDFNYIPMPGLTAAGEYSMSDSGLSASAGAAKVSAKGTAGRFELVGDADPSRVSLEYENVEPDFYSALGSATPDRRKAKARWRYKASKRVTVTSGLLWYRNNLDGANSAGTTRNWKPEISAAVKKPFASRPYSFADVSYKFDRKYGAGSSGADHYMNLNYRDRFGALDSDTNLGYTLYKTKTAVRDAKELNFNTSLNSRHEAGSVVLKPAVNLGAWYSRDELSETTDKLYEYSLGLGLEAPGAKLTADLRAGQNRLVKSAAGSDDSKKFFAALGAYWRPKLLSKLNDSTLFLRAGFNEYGFSTAARNFREKSVTAGLNASF
ncbi:MAG: hypothetical protein PHV36_09915 [Elusimicrobiales bacterium]|nr:hypothetical protein [Elusimicrobiales bacterium]